MDKEKLLDLLDRQTFAYHEMQPESPEDYTAEYKKGYNEGLKFAIAYIDQLDEPEVLSQEWIEEKSYDRLILEGTMDDEDETFVSSYDLQNLLVPKQEEAKEPEKVVVPEFVAEWIRHCKRVKANLFWAMTSDAMSREVRGWIEECGLDLFARAWLDGYTVEEKKYEVKFCTGGTLQGNPSLIVLYESVGGEILAKEMPAEDYRDFKKRVPSSYHLTEKQIKDYDFRFWPFAEEVTE